MTKDKDFEKKLKENEQKIIKNFDLPKLVLDQKGQTLAKLQALHDEALETEKYGKLEKFCITKEFQSLPYEEKNRLFITSSKVKTFGQCQLAYKYKYIDLIPERIKEDKEYFVVGQAFDDLTTHGDKYYDENYIVLKSRVSDIDSEIQKQQEKIEDAKNLPPKKDGSMLATAKNSIVKSEMKIKFLIALKEKVQLTYTMQDLISQMHEEFLAQKLFNHKPKKRVFFWKYRDRLIKIELDDFDGKTIRDVKTSANVLRFDPEFYEVQACLYHLVVEENTMDRLPVQYEIVDKYRHFSRSLLIEYTQQTLLSVRGRILSAIDNLIDAEASDIFFETDDQEYKYNSGYYGYNGYGRPTKPELY